MPRADCRISMPSWCTELERDYNTALARCNNLASRPCNPRAADAMKSTAPSSKSFGLHVLAIYLSGALFRIPFRIPFQLSFLSGLQALSKNQLLYYMSKRSFKNPPSMYYFSKSLPTCLDVPSKVFSTVLST